MDKPNNLTEHEQRMWEHYQKVEVENIKLHNQLAKMRKENKHLRHVIRVWKGKYNEYVEKERKQPSRKANRHRRHHVDY